MARNPDKLVQVPWRGEVEVARGDLNEAESLTAAFDDVDVVYYLVHSMGSSPDFAAEERRSAKNVVAAARATGVRRLVYLSGLHPDGVHLSPHLESRTAVGEILLSSGIETVVLQAGVIIGSGSASFEMVRHLTDRLPAMTTPKWVHNKIQPIAVRDVLHYLIEAASANVPKPRAWDIGGPDVLEYGEMMQIYAEIAGLRRRLIIVLPFLTPTIASWWVGLVTPIPSGLARPLVESLHCDAVMANHDIDNVINRPSGGLTGYRKAVMLALERIATGQVETTWSPTEPSEPLPTDPAWAGEVAYTTTGSQWTPATPDQLWTLINSQPIQRGWRLDSREAGESLRLRRDAATPYTAWLEMSVGNATGPGSCYHQRVIYYPQGITGRIYWYCALPLRRRWFSQRLRHIVDLAGSTDA